MKTIKTLLAGFLAIGLVSAAQAQTVVRLTGSTAFRGSTLTAMLNIMDPGFTYGYVGAVYTSSRWVIIKGDVGGIPVILKTSFSGSEGGIHTVAGSLPITYLPDNSPTSAGGTPNLPDPTGTGPSEIPDIAMSDTFQSTSFFFGNYFGTNYPALNAANTTPGLPIGQVVGIVQFKWIAGRGIPAGLTNMTQQLARNLFSTGKTAVALWTGLAADHGTSVFAIGRDFDSGTRLTFFAESGIGAKAVVKQYFPYDAANQVLKTAGGTIDHISLTPAGVINGIPYGPGNGGYASGGDLAKGINNTPPANSLVIGYSGTGDANSQITNNPGTGLTELAWNGVKLGTGAPPVDNSELIKEGAYTMWGYEHLYYRDATAGVAKTVADTLALRLFNTDSPAPLYNDMQVSRLTDGGVVIQKY
jgi:hypothetical protein